MDEEQLYQFLSSCYNLPKETVIELVQEDFQEFLEKEIQSDDVTVVTVATIEGGCEILN